jgi:hypothetical protein
VPYNPRHFHGNLSDDDDVIQATYGPRRIVYTSSSINRKEDLEILILTQPSEREEAVTVKKAFKLKM